MDDGVKELADVIRRDRVERARRMPFEAKFLAGGALFDSACEVTKAGIRSDHPEWSEQEVISELRHRLERRRAREYRHLLAERGLEVARSSE